MSVLPNEGNQDGRGGAGASQIPSDPSGQPLEANFATLKETLSQMAHKLEAQDGEIRALKSGKDKAVDRALSEIQPVKESIAKIARYLGVDEEKVRIAQREAVLDSLVEEKLGNSQPITPASGMAERSGGAVELQSIETALGLPSNDPRVTELKLKYANDAVTFTLEAAKLKQSLSAPPPTPAEQPLPGGTGQRPPPNLQVEYENARANVMSSTRAGEERVRALAALKSEYAGKGLPVY